MKGGFPGASSEVASSSADGRLAWIQASRVLREPGPQLPWQRSSWMRDIFGQTTASSLPTFDRTLFSEVLHSDPKIPEPATK
eukprot:1446334-Amphidinium_carterae.1